MAPHSKRTLTSDVSAIKDGTAVFPFVCGVLSWNWCTQELLLLAVMSWLGSTSFDSELGIGCAFVLNTKQENLFYLSVFIELCDMGTCK